MNADIIIRKIKEEQKCSIETAEILTKALHNENLLNNKLSIRFKPLFETFDILETTWFSNNTSNYYKNVGDICNLKNVLEIVNNEYKE